MHSIIVSSVITNYKAVNSAIILNSNIVLTTSIGVYVCAIPYVIALFLSKRLSTLLSLTNLFVKDPAKI